MGGEGGAAGITTMTGPEVATEGGTTPVRILTPRLVLSMPDGDDIPRILAFYERNREHLDPWEPPQPEGFLTETYWRARLARFRAEARDNVSLRLFVFPKACDRTGPVLGVVSFTRMFALPVPCARLGYAIDRESEATGRMGEAVRAALRHIVDVRGVTRITATHQVDNVRSARLLARLGFRSVCVLPRYLFSGGAWHDHTLVERDFETDGE